MSLNCKVIYIIQSNVIFVKNFCFKDAVKVKRFYVENDDDFVSQIFERNFFANINSSFCLVQQITPEDEKKYFIFGVKFDDLYIFVCSYIINLLFLEFKKAKKQAKKVIKKINKLIDYTTKKGYDEFEDLITDLKEKASEISEEILTNLEK